VDLGVTLIYMLWGSQHKQDYNKVHLAVIKDIYGNLSRSSSLFAYLLKQGVKADDIIGMISYDS